MAYHPQPCDTFFVESSDGYTQRSSQDYIKMIGRRKQEAMANELSRQACDTYGEDIHAHMVQMESETLPDVASINIQQEIQWFMRPYLIDFLIEAHSAFQLLPETLFLAINLLDRYCSRRVVYKRHYQLVGCAALLIAAKYGDKKERVPLIRELKSMCCSLYDEDMFTQMEWHVLNTLDWQIGHPTVDAWIKLAFQDSGITEDQEVEHMAWYLCEIALYHKDFVSKKPSVMARASLALARGILQRPDMECDSLEVNRVLIDLSHFLHEPSQVLYRKYALPHLSGVSNTIQDFLVHQEMMSRQAAPPTPPSENVMRKAVGVEMFPGTPQKQQFDINGYMTPPITPEGDCHGNPYDMQMTHQQVPRCPVTPTPMGHNQYVPQPYGYQHPVGMYQC